MSKPREDSWEARMARKAKAAREARQAEPAQFDDWVPVGAVVPLPLDVLIDDAVEEVGHFRIEGDTTWVNAESLPAIIEHVARTGYFAPVAMA